MLSPTYTQNKSFEKRRTTIVNFFPNAPMRIPLKMLDSLNLHSVSLMFLGRWPSLLEFFLCACYCCLLICKEMNRSLILCMSKQQFSSDSLTEAHNPCELQESKQNSFSFSLFFWQGALSLMSIITYIPYDGLVYRLKLLIYR